MANPSDPFSASVIPFEVPEQMRALAEKGVSQARDSYARFKDVGEVVRLHTAYVQAQMRSLAEQASEMSQIVGRAAMEAAKPKI